jgi:hypothetical protein
MARVLLAAKNARELSGTENVWGNYKIWICGVKLWKK